MIRLLVQSDKEIMLDYISRNSVGTSFLYANVIESGIENNKDIRRCADYFGFFKNGELKGILPFYNLGSCLPHYESEEAIPYFAGIMKERSFDFMTGMHKIIGPLHYEIKASKGVDSYDESTYMINIHFIPFVLEGLNFSDACGDADDELINFIIHARANGFNQIVTREEVIKTLTQRGKEEDFIVAEKDGKIVAQACIQTYTPQLGQIGGVYTLEDERSKGYCKAVVSEICSRIISRSKTPSLFAKKDNVPAVKAYTSLGFSHYDDYLIIRYRKNDI